uniref:Uncharacterized protein n=1 Tax=Nothoprocta perdicaria TaxID=30464 RepID=A0A8C7E977_NOTPE
SQQHPELSHGQHLITAIADQMFGFKTTSWELGRQRSVIELDTPTVTAEQVEALERSVNEKIRERIPVTVRELAADDPEVETVGNGAGKLGGCGKLGWGGFAMHCFLCPVMLQGFFHLL